MGKAGSSSAMCWRGEVTRPAPDESRGAKSFFSVAGLLRIEMTTFASEVASISGFGSVPSPPWVNWAVSQTCGRC